MGFKERLVNRFRKRLQHYDETKYWKRRKEVINPTSKKNKLTKIRYLYYIKKCDAFNCASFGTNFNVGAKFASTPNLPHGLNGIIIGYNVVIGSNCTILQRVTIAEGTKEKPTIIGNNVFIGSGAVIRSSMVIGDNVKIGANAVVTHNIPSNTVVGGVPAKIIKVLRYGK